MQRYYYKNKDNTGFANLKSPLTNDDYIQITEEEFEELTKPKVYTLTAEQKAAQEKAKKIAEYKKYLADTDYIVLKIAEAQSKKVYQYTLDGELVKIWKSAMDCGRNGYSQGNVSACCRGERDTHKNYIWKYE